MKEKQCGRCIGLLLIAALVAMPISPVMATGSGTELSDQAHSAEAIVLFSPQENIEGFDQEIQKEISPPEALTEVSGLSIDSTLVSTTPYWIYLAAGKKEQQALIDFVRKSEVPEKKKIEWIRFLQNTWKKYPLKLVRKGSAHNLELLKPAIEYVLTKQEITTFAEIDTMIVADMEKTSFQPITPKFAEPQHQDFLGIAIMNENIPNELKQKAINSAPIPDDGYSDDPIDMLAHSINHGYLVTQYSPTVEGAGLAPQNTGMYALSAKGKYLLHDYSGAFTDLGYSSHFITDLGQPYHTPNLILAIWPSYDDPFSTDSKIIRYKILHDKYEEFVNLYWISPLPNGRSFSNYANSATGATVIIEPTTSARYHAMSSNFVNLPLYYLCNWHYLFNRNYEFQNNTAIIALTGERVVATTENTRGLVRFVTGSQAPTLTITATAGEHGSISPAGSVTVNYGDTPTFTITPENTYRVDQILVDGSPVTQNPYPFPPVTTDHTISAIFKRESLPAIVPLCQAGEPFDSTKYPQNWPQSDPMTFSCDWDGNGRVYVSGSSSELIGTYADDGFTVDTPKGIQFDAEGHYAHQHEPLDITGGMNSGSNTLTLIVRNYVGLSMSYGSSTGFGTDQEPYIVEINDPSMMASARSIASTTPAFMPNSTAVEIAHPIE